MSMSAEEIFEKVQENLVDALGVDDDEVTLEATLMGDLGAESIDFLDIVEGDTASVAIGSGGIGDRITVGVDCPNVP